MYNMSGIDTTPFLFNWGLLSYGVLCSHLLIAILMQQKNPVMIAQKPVAEYDTRVSLLKKVRFMQWLITSCETNVRLGSVVEK